ncbi:MAG: histidine kinase [Calditrichaceae bacterium]|nr:histidine kinase [Calditrichia bacterium]NUQ40266.1 histidine kinase [Calditrichaceae bacterium]
MEPRRYKQIRNLILGISAVLVAGAFLSFVFLARTTEAYRAILIGYFYAFSLAAAVWPVYRWIAPKLTVFSPLQQWLMKTALYTVAISAAYLTGLVFQTLILLPPASLREIAIEHLWKGFVFVVSLPFGEGSSETLLSVQSRGVLISFFSMLFLIGLASMAGSLVELRWQQNRQRQALERAELTALRAQIEPHFLFNSLNTIASLIRQDPPAAERLLLQLSEILRYLFQNASKEAIPLRREIEFTRQYLALLQARFGEKLQVEWHQSLRQDSRQVPALLLQPIIENVVQHGWPDRRQPLKISLSVKETERHIVIEVADDGRGIAPERLRQLPLPGHALENISERLYLLFKEPDLLQIRSRQGGGTTVEIRIPLPESYNTKDLKGFENL